MADMEQGWRAAQAALAAGNVATALPLLRRLAAEPDCPAPVKLDLARALLTVRREAEALAAARTAAETAPDDTLALLWVGEIEGALDEREAAAATLRRVLELDPMETRAYVALDRIGAIKAESSEAQALHGLLDQPGLDQRRQAEAHYCLSHPYKRADDDERFLAHMFAANAAQRAANPGSRAFYERRAAFLNRVLSDAALRRAASADAVEPTPIFIIGMPRSGTTLTEQIVSGHADVAAGGELRYTRQGLGPAMQAVTGLEFPEGLADLSVAQLNALALPWNEMLALIADGARFVTDKTPDNYQFAGVLAHLFSRARFVAMKRGAMDTCFSIIQQPFNGQTPHTFDIELLAYAYAQHERQLQRWSRLLGERLLIVPYEALSAAPAEWGARILAHCGLSWSDALLDFHQRKAAVYTLSAAQVRQPVNMAGVGAWRRYAEALQPLRAALIAEGVEVET